MSKPTPMGYILLRGTEGDMRLARHGAWYGDWCRYTEFIMSREKLSQTAVARALGINQANVHHYIAGKVKPPLEQMALWAKVLGLSREEKVQFNRRAWEVHSPPEMVALSKSMDARIVELNATVASLRRENAELLHVIREMEEGGRMPLT